MIVVDETFAENNNESCLFLAVQLNNPSSINFGKWIINENAFVNFPELFEGYTMEHIEITKDDFIKE